MAAGWMNPAPRRIVQSVIGCNHSENPSTTDRRCDVALGKCSELIEMRASDDNCGDASKSIIETNDHWLKHLTPFRFAVLLHRWMSKILAAFDRDR